MSRTILVPVDGSDPSRAALGHALALADDTGATVHVLAVVEPSGNPLAFGVDEVADVDRAVADLVETIVAGDGRTGVRVRSDVRRGRPTSETILAYAADVGADLVVLGRRGAGRSGSALGSTADRVARSADVPVTIVPDAGQG